MHLTNILATFHLLTTHFTEFRNGQLVLAVMYLPTLHKINKINENN